MWRVLIASVVMTGLLPAVAAAQAPDIGVEAITAPGGEPLSTLTLAIEPGATETAMPIYVRHKAGDAVENLRLVADVQNVKLEITPDGGTAGAEADLAKDGFVRYTVVAKDATARSVEGRITALAGARSQTLANVVVTRPPSGQTLAIDGAGDDGVVRTSDVPRVSLALAIVSKQRDEVDDLRVAVTALTGETQEQVRPEVRVGGAVTDGRKVHTVPGNEAVPLDITAQLEAGGVYTASIRLTYGGQTTIVPLQITRNRTAPTVVFDEVPEQRMTASPLQKKDVTFTLPVTEDGGRTVELPRPVLILKRIHGAASERAKYDRFTVDGQAAGTTTLTPGQSREIAVRVEGLEGPGEYSALLRFRGAGGDPKDVATKLWVRAPEWLALLVLLIAVVIGETVRQLRTKRLAALVAQTELMVLNDRLEEAARQAGATAEEQPVLQALRDMIAEVHEAVGRKPEKDITSERTELDAKIGLVGRWLAATRDARAAGWPGNSREKLRTVTAFLSTRGQSDPAAARSALQEVEGLLTGGPDVRAALEELEQAVAAWLSESQASEDDKKAVNDAVAEARAKLGHAPIGEAETAYDAAAAKLASVAAAELLSLAQAAAPRGVEAADWETLRTTVRSASASVAAAEPRDAVAIYQDAYKRYLATLVAGLRTAVKNRITRLEAEKSTDKAGLDKLRQILASLEQAAAKAERGSDLRGVRTAYEDARTGLAAIKTAAKMSEGATFATAAAAPDIPGRAATRGLTPAVLLPTARATDARRRHLELALTLIAAFFAAASGLLLLYFPDPGWGTWEDFAIAALWGAGVHAVANAAFQSVPSMLGRIGVGPAQ